MASLMGQMDGAQLPSAFAGGMPIGALKSNIIIIPLHVQNGVHRMYPAVFRFLLMRIKRAKSQTSLSLLVRAEFAIRIFIQPGA